LGIYKQQAGKDVKDVYKVFILMIESYEDQQIAEERQSVIVSESGLVFVASFSQERMVYMDFLYFETKKEGRQKNYGDHHPHIGIVSFTAGNQAERKGQYAVFQPVYQKVFFSKEQADKRFIPPVRMAKVKDQPRYGRRIPGLHFCHISGNGKQKEGQQYEELQKMERPQCSVNRPESYFEVFEIHCFLFFTSTG
jgi:hypothetical protein